MTGMIPAAASNEVRDASNEVLVNGQWGGEKENYF